MKKIIFILAGIFLISSLAFAEEEDRGLMLTSSPAPAIIGREVVISCQATGEWRSHRIRSARISIWNADGNQVAASESMPINGMTAAYNYLISQSSQTGTWRFECRISDGHHTLTRAGNFMVIDAQIDDPPAPGPDEEYTTLTYDDFEDGWGNYTDGGRDCSLYTNGAYAHQGHSAANIQDNSGRSSSFYLTHGIDVATPGYTEIKIEFYFYAVSMEKSEDFRVQYYDGSEWRTIADYVRGRDFNNNEFNFKTITLSKSEYTFPSDMKIRFMCDASGNRDDVYIDEVKISATGSEAPSLNNPPAARVGGPYSGIPGESISFSGSGSSDPDGDDLTYAWNFGDGGFSSEDNPSHTYAADGNYTVTLTVNDGHGGSDSDQTTAAISVSNHPPTASVGGPYSGTPGESISFSGSESSDPDGDDLTYAWDFGDGGFSSEDNPSHTYAAAGTYTVTLTVNDGHGGTDSGQVTATIMDTAGGHASIQSYNGPATCIACHPDEARDMLTSLHMKWSGPTPELTNTNGEELGKQVKGINTFCTYAVSSKNACYTCHVRSDGNADHPATVNDVDCLMCHSDVYQRKFVADPDNTQTVTNVLGETKTYMLTMMDDQGNYISEPDFANMPTGTTMTGLARNVQMPTRKSCLKCHAKAGGGDWTKRGDMGLNSANPTIDQDVHMSTAGADLNCADCHAASGHRIGGRGIDLRETEAPDPKCANCHTTSPHSDATINRHANGQVGCQVCHIRSFGKGGATEIARDWREPEWNAGFCNGQGGFVGLETKIPNNLPEYRFFDGTSYVYNVGETIAPNPDGTYTMAKANGAIFDGKSKIVPIKDHWSTMAITPDGKIVPPVIMDMFMTGDFDKAVQAGMDEQGMPGTYEIVQTDAEMLITHGVDPKSNAPSCAECHAGSGKSNLMIPFAELGYHKFLSGVESCTRCHERESASFTSMHSRHVDRMHFDCTRCHVAD